jgi:hypothetical protein
VTLIRHSPPCDDPGCMPCWWDALDREMYSVSIDEEKRPMSLVEKVAKGLWELFHALDGVEVRWKPFSVRHQPPRWEDR